MQLERRAQTSRAMLLAAPIGAVLATLAITSLLVAWAGAPVGRAYALLLEGGFGSRFAWTETLTRATPLILTGLAAAVAFRARLYNIGGEGQLYAGAMAAVAVGGLHGGTGSPDSKVAPHTLPPSGCRPCTLRKVDSSTWPMGVLWPLE